MAEGSTTDDCVLLEVSERIATITLNRPEARNALSSAVLRLLPERMREAEANPDVDVLILTGTDPAFCAGLDLKELGSSGGNLGGGSGSDGSRNGDGIRGPFPRVSKPLIGAVNGVAITGGFELALNCDFLVASEHAKFGDTHSRVGVMPGWGLTVLLPQAIGVRRAREMSFTGNFMLADEALAFGLVNHVVPHAELIPTARAGWRSTSSATTSPACARSARRTRRSRPTTIPGRSRPATAGPGAARVQPRPGRRPPRRHPSPRPAAVAVVQRRCGVQCLVCVEDFGDARPAEILSANSVRQRAREPDV